MIEVPGKQEVALSDVDYLAMRSRRQRSSSSDAERSGIKSWLVTARLMFPDQFGVQYEAYAFEKEEAHPEEAAKYLRRLFMDFGSPEATSSATDRLWTEIDAMVDLLSMPGREEAFPCRVFSSLPPKCQREMLLAAAFHTPGSGVGIDRSKKLLLAFKRFPDLVPEHGSDLVAFIIAKCKKNLRNKQPNMDDLLKLLIMEVCPLLVPVTELKIDQSTLHDLLLLTFEFIFALVASKDTTNPWKTILTSFEEIGLRMGWSLTEDLVEQDTKDPDGLFQRVVSCSQQKRDEDEVFYVATVQFLKAFSEYMGHIENCTLVEAFVTHEEPEPELKLKRRRTTDDERKVPLVTCQEDLLLNGFLVAVKYYDLLRSDPALEARLQAQLRPPENLLMTFYVDMSLFQGRLREASQTLRHLPTPQSEQAEICLHTKLAAIHYCLGDYQAVADQVVQALGCLKETKDSEDPDLARQGLGLKRPTNKNRHLTFLQLTKQNLLAYTSRLLIYVLKDRGLQPTNTTNDLALGHVIVLLQYCYPEEKDLFYLLLHRIRMKDTFSYPTFCQHVIHVDFLEEFAHLMVDTNNTHVALDITPGGVVATSTSSSGRRMGTRGANRGEKNEIKTALKKQVSRSYENIDTVITDFLLKNRDSICQCLL